MVKTDGGFRFFIAICKICNECVVIYLILYNHGGGVRDITAKKQKKIPVMRKISRLYLKYVDLYSKMSSTAYFL